MKTAHLMMLTLLVLAPVIARAQIICPKMPDAVNYRASDIKSEISGSVAKLGAVKAGDIAIKTEITAKNLFESYPSIDNIVKLQILSATYCSFIRDAKIPDLEKLNRWEKFQDKILELQNFKKLPGDTGWIFVGYFDKVSGIFTEGPYVNLADSDKVLIPSDVDTGKIVRLKASKEIKMVNYKKSGQSNKFMSPIRKGIIDDNDSTDVILAAGTELLIRDVSTGKAPQKKDTALWVRVVYPPRR